VSNRQAASAKASGSPGGTSGTAPAAKSSVDGMRDATAGTFEAIASRRGSPNPSSACEGKSRRSQPRSSRAISSGGTPRRYRSGSRSCRSAGESGRKVKRNTRAAMPRSRSLWMAWSAVGTPLTSASKIPGTAIHGLRRGAKRGNRPGRKSGSRGGGTTLLGRPKRSQRKSPRCGETTRAGTGEA